jgi:hypothetical protein
MEDFPSTVDFSRMSDREAIEHFYDRYVPLLRPILSRRLRKADPDGEMDILHDFLLKKVIPRDDRNAKCVIRGWNPTICKFRWYLLRAFDNYVDDYLRQTGKESQLQADAADQIPDCHHRISETQIRWVQGIFEFAWARYESQAPEAYVELYRQLIVNPLFHGVRKPTYSEIRERFGYDTDGQVAGAFHRAREKFDTYLIDVVRDYAGCVTDDDLLAEFLAIRSVLDDNNALRILAEYLQQDFPRASTQDHGVENSQQLVQSVFESVSEGLPKREDEELTQVLQDDLEHLRFDTDGRITTAVINGIPRPTTLGDILCVHHGPEVYKPPLPLLVAIKKVLKPITKGGSRHLSAENAKVLYCGLVGTGITVHGEPGRRALTSLTARELTKNFQKVIQREAVPERLSRLLREAIESLEMVADIPKASIECKAADRSI